VGLARELRALDALRQPSLRLELVEMRRERPGSGGTKRRGCVVPYVVEQFRHRPLARVERRDQPPLAVEPMGDVLIELRGRIRDDGTVTGQ